MRRSVSIEFWERIFRVLTYFSLFKYIKLLMKGKDKFWWPAFIDLWVLINFFLSILSIFLIRYIDANVLNYILVYYGFIRVLEIVVHQMNILLFDEYRAKLKGVPYEIRGYRRTIVNLLTNFAEIIFWFATSYAVFFDVLSDKSIMRLIFNSFSVMTTFGESNLETANLKDGYLFIFWFQSIAGLFMTLLSIARFIGLMPKVTSIDEFEKEG